MAPYTVENIDESSQVPGVCHILTTEYYITMLF